MGKRNQGREKIADSRDPRYNNYLAGWRILGAEP